MNHNNGFIRVMWRSYPYGWSIRSLTSEGEYQAELLIGSPTLRRLHSGRIAPADAAEIFRLADLSLTENQSGPVVDAKESSGHLARIDVEGEVVDSNIYYFRAQADVRPATFYYVEILYLIDGYIRPIVREISAIRENWRERS